VLTAYLAELQKVALLTPDEERTLWHRYRLQGEADGRLRLIEAYQPLVFKVVMQIRPPDAVLMDMLQEGTVGLIEAVERFDHTRGIRFSTFAPYRIRGRVLNALRRVGPWEYSLEQEDHGDTPPISRLPDPSSDDAFAGVEEGATLEQVRQAIDDLPEREGAILRAAYVESRAPRRIAADLQISLSHFYRLHKQALAHMRALVLDDVHQPRKAPGY
jgi:RNA polymerase sporulation-specific sigma factor